MEIEALTLYAERVAAAFERALSSKKKPDNKIRALLRFVAGGFEDAGFEQSCAAGAVTLDLNAEVAALRPKRARHRPPRRQNALHALNPTTAHRQLASNERLGCNRR